MSNAVANIILRQLGGAGRVRAMLGVKSFVAEENGLSFRFPNPRRSLANHIRITLNGLDLYDIEFSRIVKYDTKILSTKKDIYAESMKEVIEKTIELYLSL